MIHYGVNKKINLYRQGKEGPLLFIGDQEMNLADVQGKQAVHHYPNSFDVDINGKAMFRRDLTKILKGKGRIGKHNYSLIVDSGSGEHVKDLYKFLYNVFNHLEIDGISIHFNPMIGHFPGHGTEGGGECYHWFTEDFWKRYANLVGVEILELGIEAAYHNKETGKEVVSVYTKTKNSVFTNNKETLAEFRKIYSSTIHGDPIKKDERL